MSTKYKFKNTVGSYFISFAVVEWVDVFTRKGVDVFTRKEYKDLLVTNLKYCQQVKGLELFAWCIMSNHVHLIARAKEGFLLQDIIRDFKKYTSKLLIKTIQANRQEGRKDWMIAIFSKSGKQNSANQDYQF